MNSIYSHLRNWVAVLAKKSIHFLYLLIVLRVAGRLEHITACSGYEHGKRHCKVLCSAKSTISILFLYFYSVIEVLDPYGYF